MTDTPVCVFAKPPVPGKAKTRLARTIGAAPAAALASAMLQDVWAVVSSCPGVFPVLAAAEEGWWPIDVDPANVWVQSGDGLGTRIERILIRALLVSCAAIALGADSPLLTPKHVEDALTQLQTHDAVIGPSPDGGFYLLGIRRCPATLFDGIPWSSVDTLTKTVERLSDHGMQIFRLPMLGDVDTVEDLNLLREELQAAAPEIAPATRQWFTI